LKSSWQNGYAERLMRSRSVSFGETIEEEEVELSEYRNFEEAYQEIRRFLDEVYTKKRIHSSVDYLTSMGFENQWREQQTEENRNSKEAN
jgi:putative transposase